MMIRGACHTRLQPSRPDRTLPCRGEKPRARPPTLAARRAPRRNFSSCGATSEQLQLAKVDPTAGFDSFPNEPAVYGVYDANEKLQFVGLTRKLRMSVMGHARDVPDLTQSIRYDTKPGATRDELTEAWKQFLQQRLEETGEVPPGNRSGDATWKQNAVRRAKPELRLTPGKGIEDLSIPMAELIDQVVKSTKVVAFIKGTRTEPQCGFSYQVLSVLNRNRVDYEVVNVMDEVHNPQLYVNGELVGGADIVTEMQEKGELQELLQQDTQRK